MGEAHEPGFSSRSLSDLSAVSPVPLHIKGMAVTQGLPAWQGHQKELRLECSEGVLS